MTDPYNDGIEQVAQWYDKEDHAYLSHSEMVAAIRALKRPEGERSDDGGPIEPVGTLLHCPKCQMKHIDRDEWMFRPHRTHKCENCGHEWRPFRVHTAGFDFYTRAVVERLCDEAVTGLGWARALRLIERFVIVRESGNIPSDEWRGLWEEARALVEEIRAARRPRRRDDDDDGHAAQ